MASHLNVVNSLTVFYKDIDPLLKAGDMFFYIELRSGTDVEYVQIRNQEELDAALNERYDRFYITSEPFDRGGDNSFYDEEFFEHVIEGLGGRIEGTDLEKIGLRVVAKAPDAKVKRLFAKIIKEFKAAPQYGVGIGPGTSSLYKTAFYHKQEIEGRTLWFDLKRRTGPIIIP